MWQSDVAESHHVAMYVCVNACAYVHVCARV